MINKETVKYTQFKDIPQLIKCSGWACDFSPEYLIKQITTWEGYTWEKDAQPTLQMNPDFQRGHVWTETQQVAYMEFLLRGGTSGRDLFFNCPSWNTLVPEGSYNEFVCVDGLQRYTAIRRFIQNEIRVFGSYYSEYADSIRGTNTLRVHVNDLKTKEDVLRWYLQMNAGGTPHSEAEISRIKDMLDTAKGSGLNLNGGN